MGDERLRQCNETELIAIIKAQGLGRMKRGLPHDLLEAIAAGERPPSIDCYCGTTETRALLEKHIWDNIARARSQLPGCDGHCLSYPCSEARHAACFRVGERTRPG